MKNLSPAFFLVIIFSFFLPFTEVTCNNETLVKLTGMNLAFGSEAKVMGKASKVDMELLALIPLLLSLAGGIYAAVRIYLKKEGVKDYVLSGLGFAVAVCLIILPMTMKDPANTQSEDSDNPFAQSMNKSLNIEQNWLAGYYLAILFAVGAGGFHLMNKKKEELAAPYFEVKEDDAEPMIVCPKCGQKNPLGATFCSTCGEKLGTQV